MEISDYCKKRDLKYILLLLVTSLIPRLFYYFKILLSGKGFPKPPDTVWYIEHAKAFISNLKVDADINGIFYLGYYSVLGVLIKIFKTEYAIIFIQVLVNAFSVILVYRITEMLFNRRAALIAGLIYSAMWPLIYWSVFILTDSLFVTVLLMVVYFLLKSYGKNKKIYICLFVVSSFYMVILRPTGVISLVFILIYVAISMNKDKATKFFARYSYALVAAAILIVLASVLIYRSGMLESLRKSFYWNMRTLLETIYANGQVFDVETQYDYKYKAIINDNYFGSHIISFFINNWKHILVLYLKRFIAFFGTWAMKPWGRDAAEMLIILIKVMPVLVFLAGIFLIIRNGLLKKASIVILVILSIQFFCIFFFIDSSFRYRVPSLPFFGIIAAYAADMAISWGCRFIRMKRKLV